MRHPWIPTLVLSLAATGAWAQAINIDFGREHPLPGEGWGAAPNQLGPWNAVESLEGEIPVLLDTSGLPTKVSLACDLPFGPATLDSRYTAGDLEALLDDYLDLHSVPSTLAVSGLAPGRYAFYVYAWAPDYPKARTSVSIGDGRAEIVGGFGGGGVLIEGVHYARIATRVRAGEPVEVHLFGFGKGTLNGLQIEPLP